MGQSITTPLTLTLQHWKDVQNIANDQSVEVKKKKWVTFCTAEWPTFNVGWPQDGTFDLHIIFQVKAKVMDPGPHGHPDQVPYIVTWQNLASNPPSWVRPFLSSRNVSSPPSLPPPLLPSSPPTSSLYPTLVKRPLADSKPSVLPSDDGPLLDLLTERPPPYQPPPPQPDEGLVPGAQGGEDDHPAPPAPSISSSSSPVASRLRKKKEIEEENSPDSSSQALPLRAGPDGHPQYWPFSASDLYNWRNNNPPFFLRIPLC